ncbi:DUF3284 domain-containing protein [Erysipelothrix urinaevulpis]|uniref:DUF3284 domain-containing protein n=1 Tax=Erysipelothrix urinaevulpis TaxID=2683717 RepID=UPI00135A5D85|nr:DUF3284 domain-containing protein [Erysipelothrix urinaevulpis]
MEVTKILKGTKEECFDIILEALIHDINQETETEVTVDDIHSGYSYVKILPNRLGKDGSVNVVIDELEVPTFYQARFESNQGTNRLSYSLSDNDSESFNLIYQESFDSPKKMNQWNFKLGNFIYKRSSKKRINIMFDQLQRLLNEEK